MNHYKNIHSSLLRFCSDFKVLMESKGFPVEPINLDAHTDEAQWPDGDFLGIGEVNILIAETYSGQCMFGVSTKDDTNLFRMGEIISELVELLLPNKNIPVYDATTGDKVGLIFILDGTKVGAPLSTKTQPIQPVAVRFETDLKSS